ncbi:tyrosine-protein kinase STYK1-like [Sinocyclocheilus grahami]|uniref:tyrosine-protein kinase STYK1-like n=1 Tax=Sinocyclocheilus grahami TaxID=75366 RepID=UPI0007ACA849|nr:PREDICTED: tyrosine-protein kinase STYK1-like [Sinocyclocheilus grahami]
MAVQAQCNSSSGSDPVCYEEGSGPLAVIIIPSLLALSTLIIVSQIIWSFITKRSSAQIITGSSLNVNDGDVAARNVLIGSGLSVKVSGLDLAFKSRQSKTVDNEQEANVPVKWQAPERMMRLPLTDRSDVWSFGILLYEMITLGSPPYPDLDPSEVLPNNLANYRMKRLENCGAPLYDLIKYCCMWNFKDRPVYSAIIQLLDSYSYLADTKPLHSEQHMDICEYRRKAGLPP